MLILKGINICENTPKNKTFKQYKGALNDILIFQK